jgi:hypothetical protein
MQDSDPEAIVSKVWFGLGMRRALSLGLLGLAGLGWVLASFLIWGDHLPTLLFLWTLGAIVLFLATAISHHRTRRRALTRIMPGIAEAAGMRHTAGPDDLKRLGGAEVVPDAADREVRGLIAGPVAGREAMIAEVIVTRRLTKKRQERGVSKIEFSEIFSGLVIAVRQDRAGPPMRIVCRRDDAGSEAMQRKARRLQDDGAPEPQEVQSSSGRPFTIYPQAPEAGASDDRARFLELLWRIEAALPDRTEVFAAAVQPGGVVLALRSSMLQASAPMWKLIVRLSNRRSNAADSTCCPVCCCM